VIIIDAITMTAS